MQKAADIFVLIQMRLKSLCPRRSLEREWGGKGKEREQKRAELCRRSRREGEERKEPFSFWYNLHLD